MPLPKPAAQTFEKVMLSQGEKKFTESIDYRLVLLGSMLPDIIDKPLGGLVFRATLGNGRIYAHTLIFLLLLFGTGIFFWVKYKRPGLLALAGGSCVHHILDGMWRYPGTYFWPFYGWSFPKGDPEGWIWQWVESLLTDPRVYGPEIIGGIILLYFFGKLAYHLWQPERQNRKAKGVRAGKVLALRILFLRIRRLMRRKIGFRGRFIASKKCIKML